MDWLVFIEKMTSHLAWPTAIVFVFWMLRDTISVKLAQATHLIIKALGGEFHATFETEKENLPPTWYVKEITTSGGEKNTGS